MDSTVTRYEIELDLLERRPDLDDREAIALLRSEFALALNASHFWRVCLDDPTVTIVSRATVDRSPTLRRAA
jgi:hypothetical protein